MLLLRAVLLLPGVGRPPPLPSPLPLAPPGQPGHPTTSLYRELSGESNMFVFTNKVADLALQSRSRQTQTGFAKRKWLEHTIF